VKGKKVPIPKMINFKTGHAEGKGKARGGGKGLVGNFQG